MIWAYVVIGLLVWVGVIVFEALLSGEDSDCALSTFFGFVAGLLWPLSCAASLIAVCGWWINREVRRYAKRVRR